MRKTREGLELAYDLEYEIITFFLISHNFPVRYFQLFIAINDTKSVGTNELRWLENLPRKFLEHYYIGENGCEILGKPNRPDFDAYASFSIRNRP